MFLVVKNEKNKGPSWKELDHRPVGPKTEQRGARDRRRLEYGELGGWI